MKKSFAVLVAVFVSIFVQAQEKQVTLEDIWKKGTFNVKSVPGFNAKRNRIQYTQKDVTDGIAQINLYDLATGNRIKTIFDNSSQAIGGHTVKFENYEFSNDESKILLFEEGKYIYRRSAVYTVYVYDLATNNLTLLDNEKVLHASFSPDGSKVAFVKDNNLYYKDLRSNKTIQVTTDGKRNEIINGNCDWVYEEEFEFTQAYQWSPDGKTIAYYRFDERNVPEYTMTVYDKLYPTPYKFKYPKAGEVNSILQIKFYNVLSKNTVTANTGKETNIYIPRIKWMKDANELCIYKLNRHQNKLELLLANAKTGATKKIYEESNKYYIEINDNLQFLSDGTSFVFSSELNGYNHIYKWDWVTKKRTALTSGEYDIENLIGVDEVTNTLYYTAAESSPLRRQLYKVSLDGNYKQLLTPEKGTHSITTIEGYQFFLDKYSTLTDPPVYYLRDKHGKIVRTLEDNRQLKAKMKGYNWGKIRFMEIEGVQEGLMLHAWMITPPDFDKTKKYPVLMFQYSGPGSQQVADAFPAKDYWWHQMLAQKGYVIVCADGTGTGFRGEEFKKKTYLQLGKLESEDQIAIARNLTTLPYVDKDRIGIWGWSYGGFMSTTCLFKGADIFKAAIAVAPVTNWRYYDNIYTERYMRTPAENASGYDDNSPVAMVKKLNGKLLLIHGTGDDNVHFQNSVMLVDELIKEGKEFDSEYYPNKAHGISGSNTRFHLYKRMTDFILENL